MKRITANLMESKKATIANAARGFISIAMKNDS